MATTGLEKDNPVDSSMESKKGLNSEPKGSVATENSNTVQNACTSIPESVPIYPISSQMTVQGGGYDPNRIPSSIFASKSATPMEWSVASNESLFSIHMGNNSFSRDHVFMLYKSGEFPKLEDSSTNLSPAPLPFNQPENVEKKSQDLRKETKYSEVNNPESEGPVFNPRAPYAEPDKFAIQEKPLPVQADEVRHSSSSTHSFQFPLLEGNYIGGGGSVKVGTERMASPRRRQYDMHPQPAEMPPKSSSGSSWFACFSCCSSHGC